MKQIFKSVYRDIIDNSADKGPMSFVFKTKYHVAIAFIILSENNVSYEKICSLLPDLSRSSIHAILSEGLKLGYFNKNLDKDDKRIKYYDCEKIQINLEKWCNRQKEIFANES